VPRHPKNHLQRLARAQALNSDGIDKGNFDGLLDPDDFGGIEERMVAASSDEPSSNPSSEPSLVPSIQSRLCTIFEAICDVALLHPNGPSGTPFSGTRCRTGYWLAIQVNFFFFFSVVLTIS
jgi:hypothetical protein